jgi:hypothetical protein
MHSMQCEDRNIGTSLNCCPFECACQLLWVGIVSWCTVALSVHAYALQWLYLWAGHRAVARITMYTLQQHCLHVCFKDAALTALPTHIGTRSMLTSITNLHQATI